MWCSHCQQDIPAIASPEDQLIRCAKCRREVSTRGTGVDEHPAAHTTSSPNGEAKPNVDSSGSRESIKLLEPPPFDFDQWEWDELSEARRAVGIWAPPGSEEPSNPALAFTLPVTRRTTARSGALPAKRTKTRRFSTLAWCILSLGVMACVFGGVLLVWSFVTERAELWSLGLPFAIGGQAALVMGLVLQLDGLWQSSDEAVETLGELDEQLLELRRATSQISATHSRPGQSFYFHMAEGASPQMLLADLKGQLDLLALRIGDERRAG